MRSISFIIAFIISLVLISASIWLQMGDEGRDRTVELNDTIVPLRPLPVKPDRASITIGVSLSTSGHLIAESDMMRQGFRLWMELVNSRGGVQAGAHRYPVELIEVADDSTPETVSKNYQHLIVKEKVDFLFAPYSSTLTMEARMVAEQYGVILIVASGASEKIYNSKNRCTFAALTSASWYTKDFFDLVRTLDSPPKSFAVLTTNRLFAKSVGKGARIWGLQNGLSEVYFKSLPEVTDNYSAYLAEIAQEEPDLLIFAGHSRDAIHFTRQLQSFPSALPKAVLMTLGPSQKGYVDELGEAAEGMIGMTQWLPDSGWSGEVFGSAIEFTRRFQKQYGYTPSYHAAQAATCGVILQQALKESTLLEAEAVVQAMRQLDIETFYGPIKYDQRGLNIRKPMALVQIQNGVPVTVWPVEPGEVLLRYPLQSKP